MAKVLVVEDDRDTREMLHLILEDAGYTVAEAVDGLAGLAALQASTVPLVVLLDVSMPKLNGIEFLQTVARDRRLTSRHVFILITSASLSQSRYQAAEEICAALSVPHLEKPFKMDALLDQVAAAARRLPSAPPDQS